MKSEKSKTIRLIPVASGFTVSVNSPKSVKARHSPESDEAGVDECGTDDGMAWNIGKTSVSNVT